MAKPVDIDVTKLTPLSPEVISKQATINVGTIGHVAHGKSTVVRSLSGVQTIRFKQEKKRNITIKLGYANAKVYKCDNPDVPEPECYTTFGSETPDIVPCPKGGNWVLQRHVSFVDCPGHDIFMATMLNGAAVMDAALLLVAGNEPCPQPQTSEHLAAVEIMRLKHLIILQNKVELVTKAQAAAQYDEIKNFVKGTAADAAPIVPISAVLKYNVEVIAQYLCTQIPIPPRDFTSKPHMIVIRSFDVNKPGIDVRDLQGGVAGGSILKGVLKKDDEIEIRPGVVGKDADGKPTCKPLRSRIVTLLAETNELDFAVPGGLIGVGTLLDPTLTRADRLLGQVLGHPGHLPDVLSTIEIKYHMLRRLLGVKADAGGSNKVKKLSKDEILMVNIGSTSVGGRILAVKADQDLAKVALTHPVCAKEADKIAISRKIDKHYRLIGWGEIVKGVVVPLDTQ